MTYEPRSELAPEEDGLLRRAIAARACAYAPYSGFAVGAAVETDVGVFTGCNVENASYGLTICAERVALFAAVAGGAKRFDRLALACPAVHGAGPGALMCCGACLQVMSELMAPGAPVIVDQVGVFSLQAMLPTPFALRRPVRSPED